MYILIVFKKSNQLCINSIFFEIICQFFCGIIIAQYDYFFNKMVTVFKIPFYAKVYEPVLPRSCPELSVVLIIDYIIVLLYVDCHMTLFDDDPLNGR